MEDETLKNLWKAQEEKLDRTMKINLHLLESLQKQKAASKLDSLAKFKLWAVIAGIVWVLFLGLLVWGNQFKNPFFGISVSAIALFSVIAIIVYIKHVVLIRQLDYSNSITETQKKLTQLQSSTFNIGRFLWLQMPFYTTFFWSREMISGSSKFWFIAVPITAMFTLAAIWLYKNIRPDNLDNRFVNVLAKSSPEYTSVVKARNFLNEIEEFTTSTSH